MRQRNADRDKEWQTLAEKERKKERIRVRESYSDDTDGSWMVLAIMLPDSRERQRVTE